MHDYDALLRACGYFTHRYGKIDRFDSLNEYWLATEARIRDDFNIAGVRSGPDIDFIRRKSKMKERFHAAGVRVARGRLVHEPGGGPGADPRDRLPRHRQARRRCRGPEHLPHRLRGGPRILFPRPSPRSTT